MTNNSKPRLEQKKNLIMSTAKKLLIKNGKQISMNAIADALGLAPSSLYYYYKSVPEIIDEILQNEYHDFTLTDIRWKDIEENPLSVLKEMTIMVTEFYYDNLPILQVILSQISPLYIDDDYIDDSVAINHYLKTYRDANRSLEDVIRCAIDSKQITTGENPSMILQTVRGYIFGLCSAWTKSKPDRDDIPKIMERFLTIYTHTA